MSLSRREKFTNLDVDAEEDIAANIEVADYKVLFLQLAVAVAALSAFKVQYRLSGEAPWLDMATTTGAFTTPTFPVVRASGDLTGAAVGNHWVRLDVSGVHSVRVRAAGTNSSVTMYANKG